MQTQKEELKDEELLEDTLKNVTGGTGVLGTEIGDVLKSIKDSTQKPATPEASR